MINDHDKAVITAEKVRKDLYLRNARRNFMRYIRNSETDLVVKIPKTDLTIVFNIDENDITAPEENGHIYGRLIRTHLSNNSCQSTEWLGTALTEEAMIGLIGIYHPEIYVPDQSEKIREMNAANSQGGPDGH